MNGQRKDEILHESNTGPPLTLILEPHELSVAGSMSQPAVHGNETTAAWIHCSAQPHCPADGGHFASLETTSLEYRVHRNDGSASLLRDESHACMRTEVTTGAPCSHNALPRSSCCQKLAGQATVSQVTAIPAGDQCNNPYSTALSIVTSDVKQDHGNVGIHTENRCLGTRAPKLGGGQCPHRKQPGWPFCGRHARLVYRDEQLPEDNEEEQGEEGAIFAEEERGAEKEKHEMQEQGNELPDEARCTAIIDNWRRKGRCLRRRKPGELLCCLHARLQAIESVLKSPNVGHAYNDEHLPGEDEEVHGEEGVQCAREGEFQEKTCDVEEQQVELLDEERCTSSVDSWRRKGRCLTKQKPGELFFKVHSKQVMVQPTLKILADAKNPCRSEPLPDDDKEDEENAIFVGSKEEKHQSEEQREELPDEERCTSLIDSWRRKGRCLRGRKPGELVCGLHARSPAGVSGRKTPTDPRSAYEDKQLPKDREDVRGVVGVKSANSEKERRDSKELSEDLSDDCRCTVMIDNWMRKGRCLMRRKLGELVCGLHARLLAGESVRKTLPDAKYAFGNEQPPEGNKEAGGEGAKHDVDEQREELPDEERCTSLIDSWRRKGRCSRRRKLGDLVCGLHARPLALDYALEITEVPCSVNNEEKESEFPDRERCVSELTSWGKNGRCSHKRKPGNEELFCGIHKRWRSGDSAEKKVKVDAFMEEEAEEEINTEGKEGEGQNVKANTKPDEGKIARQSIALEDDGLPEVCVAIRSTRGGGRCTQSRRPGSLLCGKHHSKANKGRFLGIAEGGEASFLAGVGGKERPKDWARLRAPETVPSGTSMGEGTHPKKLKRKCMHCHKRFKKQGYMLRHLLTGNCHKVLGKTAEDTKGTKNGYLSRVKGNQKAGNGYKCKVCGEVFVLLPDLGRHFKQYHRQALIARRNEKLAKAMARKHRLTSEKQDRGKKNVVHTEELGKANGQNGERPGSTDKLEGTLALLSERNLETTASGSGGRKEMIAELEPQSDNGASSSVLRKSLLANRGNSLWMGLGNGPEDLKGQSEPGVEEILGIARGICCMPRVCDLLHYKYAELPDGIETRVSKLCSSAGVVERMERCPGSCRAARDAPLVPITLRTGVPSTRAWLGLPKPGLGEGSFLNHKEASFTPGTWEGDMWQETGPMVGTSQRPELGAVRGGHEVEELADQLLAPQCPQENRVRAHDDSAFGNRKFVERGSGSGGGAIEYGAWRNGHNWLTAHSEKVEASKVLEGGVVPGKLHFWGASGIQDSCAKQQADKRELCADLSGGAEPVPIACVVDEEVLKALGYQSLPPGCQKLVKLKPSNDFTYTTTRRFNSALTLDMAERRFKAVLGLTPQLGCLCEGNQCNPATCQHVETFAKGNEHACDIYGESMLGRLPYDSKRQIILQEKYLVHECNSQCRCGDGCTNRVLQRGVRVRLEVFRTYQKGWAVRAAQPIPRGTFVCEYIGEVITDEEAHKRGLKYDKVGLSYLYDIDSHIDARALRRGVRPFVIDATVFGNVARFINHSCAPNLVNYQVLAESLDHELAHIGLYAARDIWPGEELAYDYRYKLLPGKGCPCHCGAATCRGRLY